MGFITAELTTAKSFTRDSEMVSLNESPLTNKFKFNHSTTTKPISLNSTPERPLSNLTSNLYSNHNISLSIVGNSTVTSPLNNHNFNSLNTNNSYININNEFNSLNANNLTTNTKSKRNRNNKKRTKNNNNNGQKLMHLNCFYTNATSLCGKTKFSEFILALASQNYPHIVCITETWFNNHSLRTIRGYTAYTKDREVIKCGGVAIYVRNDISSYEVTEHKLIKYNLIESICCEIRVGSERILVLCVYRPPTTNR